MLQDRKELIEAQLEKLKDKAAKLYLKIVTNRNSDGINEYNQLKEWISDLEFDLKIINEILDKENK